MIPNGVPSVAKLDDIGKKIETGLTLNPAKAGNWKWVSDNRIEFQPETDWPAGVDYSLTLSQSLFTETTLLSNDTYTFDTPKFEATFKNTQFYQDPTDAAIRRVISTLSFSHPVDKATLEANLQMEQQADDNQDAAHTSTNTITPYQYSVTYSKNLLEAHITSTPVSLPDSPNYMKLRLNSGVKSLLGGSASRQATEDKVLIPDVYSYLKVASATVSIVRNADNEPEQVVTLEFTDEINERELLVNFSVYRLNRWTHKSRSGRVNRPRMVTEDELANSTKLELRLIPNERSSSKTFNFKLDTAESSYLYLLVNKGLKSVNDFVYATDYDDVLTAPRYPKEVTIMGEGSILSHSGNHQLSLLTRGVPTLKYSVGKLVDGQLNHLVSQTYGDITNPTFSNWKFNKQDIVDTKERIVDLQSLHPKVANYTSFDLSNYLPEQGKDLGLFFIEVSGWNKQRNYSTGPRAERLVLITDLGIIVKDNADNSHHVFVQSIASGDPVADAEVQLLGKNGLPIASAKTDQRGQAFFASTYGYQDEKTPTVYVVRTSSDVSFIPFERNQRQLNLSKFDIGGVRLNPSNNAALKAFMFTDRGIYRPGEVVNLGLVVKNEDLSNVEGIPIELVIRGPRHQELKVTRYQLPKMGFSDFQFPTAASSDTGDYSAALHLVRDDGRRGQHLGSTNFKVEEFQPDTMKIESKLNNASPKGWNTENTISTTVSLSNLFGTPAQDRKITARVIIEPEIFNFPQFKHFSFSEIDAQNTQNALRLNQVVDVPRTDNNGNATFNIDLTKFQGGTYRTRVYVEGFTQDGGRSVKASNSVRTSPLQQLVGYKADGDLNFISENSPRTLHYIAISPKLEPLKASNLRLRLIEIQHVSTLVKQPNGTYQYQTIKKEIELSSNAVSIPETGFEYAIDTSKPGDFAVEILNTNAERVSRAEYSVAGFANLSGKIDKSAELQLTLNKQDYQAGETIELSIKAPYTGAGLISIESNTVNAFKWFKTDLESTVQQIDVPNDLEGTAYVNVAFVRDASSKEIYTSPLSYAVQPFSIDKSKRRVDIELKTADVVRPGKAMDISFSASRPSRIAVFAVDEGILQVAKYGTPNPLAYYLKKRALGVETLQILDLILPSFDLVKQLSASGGGSQAGRALAKNLNPFARKTDKPAVFWSGIYDADSSLSTVSFEVPNSFSGELRVMAVAVAEEAVGAQSRSALVRGPFVISPNVLTAAAPSDEFNVTAGIANILEGSGENVPISVTLSSSENLEIVDNNSSIINVHEGSEGKVTFRVKALNNLGAAELKFTARYNDEQLHRTASLSVRPATAYRTTIDSGVADSGSVTLNDLRRLYPDLSKQSLSASSSPLVIVNGLTSYLDSYPHGCTEQIVSKVFPMIALTANDVFTTEQGKVNKQFNRVINQLRRRQTNDGGFAFWPNSRASLVYPSIYAMHFLIDSKEAGHSVPDDMLEQGKRYLTQVAQRTSSNTLLAARNRANAIYLLTRLGVVTSNYLVDLEDDLTTLKQDKEIDREWVQTILPSYMAATYGLLHKDSDAARLINRYKITKANTKRLDDFNSTLATDAQHLYLLAKHFPEQAKKLNSDTLLSLTHKINQGDYNTISSAYSVLALGEYSKLALNDKSSEEISVIANSINQANQSLSMTAAPFPTASYSTDIIGLKASSTSSAGAKLFYINSQSGFDLETPSKVIKEGIEISREFIDEQGSVVNKFEQGREITVRLRVRALNDRHLSNIAVVDLLPGGFEVLRESVGRTATGWQRDYTDIREDRMVFYGSFGPQVSELSYKVKLTSAGDFIVPPAYAESMYDRTIKAISAAKRFQVTAAQ